jgi:lipopolysaccharide/colanic/teichoic acid biosynthesis glycosyltransferase
MIFKRFFDLLLSSIAVLLLAPVFIFIYLLILFDLGSPVLFKQERIGLKGKTFLIYKFRTMKEPKEEDENEILRLSKISSVIRKLSLDELPTLFNVLKDEMSLVGPRPLLEEYREEYSEEQFRRHDVKPGVTGWAQINGRNSISWEEKFTLDLWYVSNISLRLDFKIILLTMVKLFTRENINQSNSQTMERFQKIKK